MTSRVVVSTVLTLLVLTAPARAAAAEVTFGEELEYSPPVTSIDAGGSVTWRGNFAEHPLSSASGEFADKANGSSYTIAFAKPGSFTYYCQLHSDGASGMVARVVVEAVSAPVRVAPRPRVTAPRSISPRTRTVRVTATGAGSATATLSVTGTTLATGRTAFARAGTLGLALRLTDAARSRLRAAATVPARLRVRVVSRRGKVTTFTQPARLVR